MDPLIITTTPNICWLVPEVPYPRTAEEIVAERALEHKGMMGNRSWVRGQAGKKHEERTGKRYKQDAAALCKKCFWPNRAIS